MSIIDTLITDRTQAEVDALTALYAKPKSMWTADEWNEFLLGNHRGAYNASDMNRVLDALDYLAERVTQFGYRKPEIKRPNITEVVPGTSRLPEGYMELEYIQSSGTQCINSLFKPNQDTRVVIDAELLSSSDHATLFGSRVSASSQVYSWMWANDVKYMRSGYNTGHAQNFDIEPVARRVVDKNKNVTTVDGITQTWPYAAFQGTNNMYLFAMNSNGTIQWYATAKLYSCQIYDNGTLIRDYVPCLNPSNEVGLYDIVNGVFYGNAGAGYFLPGPAVSLPDGYTRLEYIQSTGEQFVDTGISVPHATARIIVDFAPTSVAGDHKSITGHANTAFSWTTNFLFINGEKSTITLNGVDTGIVASVGTRYVVDYNQASYSINGGDHVSTTRSFTDGYNDTIFYSSGKYGEFKLYSYQLYNGSTLIRDLAPCKNPDGEVGLYDTITGEFFGNAGVGAFVAGEELESEVNVPAQTITRDHWKIGDCPPMSELAYYLDNVRQMRTVLDLPTNVPTVPEDISQRITIEDANNIEFILTAVETLLNRISLSWFYSGEAYSGEV